MFDFRKPRSESDTVSNLTNACQFLPLENKTLCLALFSHLNQVMNDSEQNKMGLLNLQLIFSPCLNIEPAMIQLFIKYPEIWKVNDQTKLVNYVAIPDKTCTESKSVDIPPKPIDAPQKPMRKVI